jgi:predicted secreted acid phosphatase
MEDVTYNAFVFYHGLRSYKTLKGALSYFPHFVHDKGVWTVHRANDSSLTLQATVELVRELALHEVDLKDELLKEKELKEQAYKEIDDLRTELGHLKIYGKLN